MDFWRHLNTVLSSEVCSPFPGDFLSACRYCELSCQAVEAVHGDYSIELGNELQKLAQLFFHRSVSYVVLFSKTVTGTSCMQLCDVNLFHTFYKSNPLFSATSIISLLGTSVYISINGVCKEVGGWVGRGEYI